MANDNKSLTKTIEDVSVDNMEIVLDRLTDNFLTGDIGKIVIDLPLIKNVGAFISILGSVKNYFFLKKLDDFLNQLKLGPVDKEKYRNLSKNYGEYRVLENIILHIDMMKEQKQTVVYSYLFKALLNEKLSWDDFESLAFSLEHFSPRHLIEPVIIDPKKGNQIVKGPTSTFINAGLATIMGPMWGGDVILANDLGVKFWEYGLCPFQKHNKLS